MKYPDYIVELYKELQNAEAELVTAMGRNYYDKESVLNDIQSKIDSLEGRIMEEASIYAAETGGDRDGSYDPDNVMDDLIEQADG